MYALIVLWLSIYRTMQKSCGSYILKINFKNLNGFTLAEIMIVLTVIGVLTAILLPVAIQSSPDEKVMKFKKGNATLFKIINELINSDKYFLPGDFSYYPDGRELDNPFYLCASMADLVSTKEVNCNTGKSSNPECLSPWASDDKSDTPQIGASLVGSTCDTHCRKVE